MSAHSKMLRVGLATSAEPAVQARPAGPGPRADIADRQRLESWFRAHFETLWRLAARLGVPRGNVDDVVQEAFITADRRAADIASGSERRFLISTTIKLCANQRRRSQLRLERSLLAELPAQDALDAEQLLARKQLREWLDVALDMLTLEHRTVFVLHELEGFSIAEIAQLIEAPAGTVASRLARAREKFCKHTARLRSLWNQHRSEGEKP
jgi:RNA polymerase sigma-70 factor (ECF subfamily)